MIKFILNRTGYILKDWLYTVESIFDTFFGYDGVISNKAMYLLSDPYTRKQLLTGIDKLQKGECEEYTIVDRDGDKTIITKEQY